MNRFEIYSEFVYVRFNNKTLEGWLNSTVNFTDLEQGRYVDDFLSQFWPLLKQTPYFQAAWAVAKICLRLKLYCHWNIWLAKIGETQCRLFKTWLLLKWISIVIPISVTDSLVLIFNFQLVFSVNVKSTLIVFSWVIQEFTRLNLSSARWLFWSYLDSL